MDPEKRRAISRKGGKAAHARGRAHVFTTEEARAAGRKGGAEVHRRGRAHRFTTEEATAAGRKVHRRTGRKPRPPGAVPVCRQCEAPAGSRGLCVHCYARCRYQVATGKTTWMALERAGLARPISNHRKQPR
jgi:general stress protein YciG